MTEPLPTPVLGVDQHGEKTKWARAKTGGYRSTRGIPGSSTWPVIGGFMGQHEGRGGAAVLAWLQARTPRFRRLQYGGHRPRRCLASAIRTPGLLPNAKLVVDHFHVTTLANDALTAVRRRVTWAFHDRRGRKIDPQWANRRRLLTARNACRTKASPNAESDQRRRPARRFSRPGSPKELRTLLSTVRTGGTPPGAPSPTPLPGASTRRSPTAHPHHH
ncbi:transposase [Mycobacterium tuberculosis]